MSYQVLARKWRPQRFADVLGQKHITRTLQNAIEKDRVGHGYLFVGPRGIGKTTSARIFAKGLNCPSPVQDGEGHVEPCCVCETCLEIAAGTCLDVLEIDGASHNKVDDIRDLRDGVQYAPTNGRRYKIYIIDEVHMLTTQAWNALLKTLEEPPPHVKFLFATTEAHKVLATIVSRCQRFDLRRIPVPIIVERLRQIGAKENIKIEEDALTIIARAADGGMRDAQSIFDQMIAFCGGSDDSSAIRQADVIEVFGLSSSEELARLTISLVNDDPGAVVTAIHHLANNGRNLERLYADVLGYLRNVMIFQIAKNPTQIIDMSESEREQFQKLSKAADSNVIQRLIDGLLRDDSTIRYTLNKRLFLEATFLRAMRDAHALRIDDVISHLRSMRDGGDSTPAAVAPATTQITVDTVVASTPPAPPAAPAPTTPAPPAPAPTPPAPAPPAPPVPTPEPAPPPAPEPTPAPPEQSSPGLFMAPKPESQQAAEPAKPAKANAPPPIDVLESLHQLWSRLLSGLPETVAKSAQNIVPISWAQGNLTLGSPATVPDSLLAAIHQRILHCTTAESARISVQELEPEKRALRPTTEAWAAVQQSDFVQNICRIFNGRVVDVRG